MQKDKQWRDYLETILIAVFLALIVRTFILGAYRVPNSSMAPTLLPGDFIFSYKLPFGVQLPFFNSKIGQTVPSRDDLIVFKFPDQLKTTYVKRVVGIPGDRIEIKTKKLMINDMVIRELGAVDDYGPIIVPPEEVFVLGDNIEVSDDSRYWGTVPISHVESRVLIIWLSLNWQEKWLDNRLPALRVERIFSQVH